MAASFVGTSVVVTLHHPPNTLIYGRVSHVDEQTTTLALENVFYPSSVQTNGHAPQPPQPPQPQPPPYPYTQQQSAPQAFPQHNNWHQYQQAPYAPLPQISTRPVVGRPSQSNVSGQAAPLSASGATPTQQSFPSKKAFADPAILSVGRPPSTVAVARERSSIGIPAPTTLQEAPATPIKPLAEVASAHVAQNTGPYSATTEKGTSAFNTKKENNPATLNAPFSSLNIGDGDGLEDTDEPGALDGSVRRVSLTKTRTGKPMEPATKPDEDWKRTRRGGKGRKRKVGSQQNTTGQEVAPDDVQGGTVNVLIKGKGWRQTPLLQEENSSPRQPGVISGRVGLAAVNSSNRKNRKQKAMEQANGWATEDATDIQEMGEFDFANNLAKFDKRTVFNQIRNEDTTADEDRLVYSNRLARPGTNGGKNLHPTENVLDGARKGLSASYSDSTEEDFDSGLNSRRAMSRASAKRNPQRSGSGVIAEDLLSHQGSSLLSRAKSSFSRPVYASSHATGSPKIPAARSPPESPFPSPLPAGGSQTACFRVQGSNRTCHTITPGGMVALEEAATDDFGLTEDMMAENGGRGIAEVALTAIVNPGGRRLARENVNAKPVMVVLAGNHRSGARAIAAARHLLGRGLRIIVAVLGFERDSSDWDKDIRRQIDLFRRYGGTVRSWHDVENALKKLEAPPELIIDALLGRDREFAALYDNDKKEVLRIVGWANKSRASVLAVEVPSGIGGSTGESLIIEGEPLEVRAKYIVCLGAPRIGLLRALANGTGRQEPEWVIWVVDIGLNRPWKKAGIGKNAGVPFGEQWVVRVHLSEPEVDGGKH